MKQILPVLLAALVAACAPPEPAFAGGSELRFSWQGDAKGEARAEEVQRRLQAVGVEAAVDVPEERILRVRLLREDAEKAEGVAQAVTIRGTAEFRRTLERTQTDHYDTYAERLPPDGDAPVTIAREALAREDKERFPHGLRWYAVAEGAEFTADRTARERWVLCRLDPHDVTHEALTEVVHGRTEHALGDGSAVYFSVRPEAQDRMAALTEWEEDAYLAILLDGRVHSAPLLQDTLRARGQVSLPDTGEERARALAVALAAGPLPAPLVAVK